jgi:chemotaxis protein MotA
VDRLAWAGLLIGVGAIVAGNALEGGYLSSLINLPALLIVFGGTFGAVVVQTPVSTLSRAFSMALWLFHPPSLDLHKRALMVGDWCRIARRDGMLGLEKIADSTKDPFIARGLGLVVDGTSPRTIREILETQTQRRLERELDAAAVFASMGGYAPTIGLIGAVLGLMQVLGNLSEPEQLGPGIASAFVATVYGVGVANLLFLPLAERLKTLVLDDANLDDMLIDGVVALAQGEHPRIIETRLASYFERPTT